MPVAGVSMLLAWIIASEVGIVETVLGGLVGNHGSEDFGVRHAGGDGVGGFINTSGASIKVFHTC